MPNTGLIEGPMTRFIHTDNTGKFTNVGRFALDICQNVSTNAILPTEVLATRRYGLEMWNGRDPHNQYLWNGETYTRKTFTIYMFAVIDRAFDTTPVKFKMIWIKNKDFIVRVCHSIFEDKDTVGKFGVKGRELSLNWAADMDKIANLGPNGWFFKLSRNSLRAFQNYFLWCIAHGKHISKKYVARFSKYSDYMLRDGTIISLTALQLLLLAFDTFNAELTRIAQTLPKAIQDQNGYLEDIMFSSDFRKELTDTWGAQADDYFDNVIPMFANNHFGV